ncbi:MAG: molybdopterin cofactor-binding domain-containing protein [Candidatus Muiribacteriota bacterium]
MYSYADICTSALHLDNLEQIQAVSSRMSTASPPPFAAHFAEIKIDTFTGEIEVLNYVTFTDCGVAINPKLAEGQVEGSLVNGLSYALVEDYYFSDRGRMKNNGFANYKIYAVNDLPEMTNKIVTDSYESTGPYGAKSVAEININGPLPVIANAFFNATGKRLHNAPFTPEKVLKLLKS